MAVDMDWARDGKTIDSGSVISGLSSAEDDTDEFGRMLLQHAKDEQRLNRALSGPGQAFRKARPHMGIGATLEHLNGTNQLATRSVSSGGSDPGVAEQTWTAGSDPPLNIPRDWGRKARQSNGWLRRLGDIDAEIGRPASADPATSRRETREIMSHAVDWATAADRPVQSVERTTPVSSKSRRLASSPVRVEHNNSIERIRQWETEQDFTAGSFLQSTPMVTSRKRELEGIQSRGVARDQLSRISERTSPESVRDQLESRMSHIAGQPLTRRRRSSPDHKLGTAGRLLGSDKENVPINGTSSGVKRESMSNDMDHVNRVNRTRPSTTRQESIQLLKRLARVTSQSPSPSPNTAPQPVSRPQDLPNTQRQSSAQAPEVAPPAIHETPRSAPPVLPAKTPKVMGAWVDTPFTIRHDSAQPSSPVKDVPPAALAPPSPKLSQPPPLPPQRSTSAPSLPPSALSNLLSQPRTQTQNLGDDTIASLEDLLDPTLTQTRPQTDLSVTLNLDEVKAELDRLHSTGRPLSKADEERREELLVIEDMAGRLRSARQGVREVKRGLRGMEKRVEMSSSLPADHTVPGKEIIVRTQQGSIWSNLLREATTLFFDPNTVSRLDKPRPWGLTTTGLLTAAFLTWYLLETTACTIWCHPQYAHDMTGFGVNPDAPRYPFVLPTILFRPVRWLWHPITSTLVWVVGQIWTGLVAYLGILFEDEPAAQKPRPSLKPKLYQSRRSGMWEESDPVFEARQKTKVGVKEWDDRRADVIHEVAPVYETMEEDRVVREVRQEKKEGSGIGRLWSWKSSPVESAADVRASGGGSIWEEDVRVDAQPVWETGDGMAGDEVV
ncbi:hypothetical protein KVT40_005607 [Elsinoe batatas]|uniref:Uncharacterized protein n=1 Tax=Elsinoe batatas TaxID=2601811 RepID=A0A8K0L079_9PEZI|nr:hypothetical protein KVT40_005607 [Elsinoe batatas]